MIKLKKCMRFEKKKEFNVRTEKCQRIQTSHYLVQKGVRN